LIWCVLPTLSNNETLSTTGLVDTDNFCRQFSSTETFCRQFSSTVIFCQRLASTDTFFVDVRIFFDLVTFPQNLGHQNQHFLLLQN
jgi:hypothetical protein